MADSSEQMRGKTALVTGAGSGIGRATALAFAKAGANVAVVDVNMEGIHETIDQIKKIKGNAIAIKVDISEIKQVDEMVKQILKSFGRLDFACNNAGISGKPHTTVDYPVEEWDRLMNVNLKGQWLCMKYEIPAMLKDGGSIVNVSSILGKVAYQQAPAYVTAKHGLIGLTRAAALEYAESHIRINAVCPGFIYTPMLEKAGITADHDIEAGIIALHPLGRLGTAEEVAEAILWLCSPASSFVTGDALMVDGGYTIR